MSIFNSDYPYPKRPVRWISQPLTGLAYFRPYAMVWHLLPGGLTAAGPKLLGMYGFCISSLSTITVYPTNVNIYPFTNGRRLNNGNINC